MKRFLVGYDGSAAAVDAMDVAVRLALPAEAVVTLVYVMEPMVFPVEVDGGLARELTARHRDSARRLLRRQAEVLATKGARPDTVLAEGRASDVLVRLAQSQEVSMVVVGGSGRGQATGLPGSTAHRLTHLCSKPVLVVP